MDHQRDPQARSEDVPAQGRRASFRTPVIRSRQFAKSVYTRLIRVSVIAMGQTQRMKNAQVRPKRRLPSLAHTSSPAERCPRAGFMAIRVEGSAEGSAHKVRSVVGLSILESRALASSRTSS